MRLRQLRVCLLQHLAALLASTAVTIAQIRATISAASSTGIQLSSSQTSVHDKNSIISRPAMAAPASMPMPLPAVLASCLSSVLARSIS